MMLVCSKCGDLTDRNHVCSLRCTEVGFHVDVRTRTVVRNRFFTHTEPYCAACREVLV